MSQEYKQLKESGFLPVYDDVIKYEDGKVFAKWGCEKCNSENHRVWVGSDSIVFHCANCGFVTGFDYEVLRLIGDKCQKEFGKKIVGE